MTPKRDEAPDVAAARGFKEQGKADAPILPEAVAAAKREQHQKALATLVARLAQRAHVVHELRGGGFVVMWRAITTHCNDLAELEALARRVGARL